MALVNSARRSLVTWFTLFRLGTTARGVLPLILGAVIAWSQGYDISWIILVLSSVSVICIMLMTFLVNEYYDYETDLANKDFHKLSGGSRVLPMGLLPRHYSIIAAYAFLAIAVVLGLLLYFYFKTGPLTLLLGAIAIFIGYFYTAGPFRWSYRGLGEICIWFTCGWLATITGYYLQTGHLDAVATLASFPGATSVFLLILINEVPDIKSDKQFGKNNLAVRLGGERTGILYTVLLILCYVNIIVIAFFGVPLISAYLSVILLPLIVRNIMTLRKKGLAGRDTQESLSMSTMVFDHLITIIYAVSFIIAGLGMVEIRIDYLVWLAIAFIIVFGLEGLGVACSRMVLQGE
jgi:1,4-dihydroxy-2-naphthoate octaprenyltransferase